MSNVPDNRIHKPPMGCAVEGVEQKAFWFSLMRSRLYDDWNPLSLYSAHKVLQKEFYIRAARADLDRLIADGARPWMSDSIAHDVYANIAKVEREQLNLIRSLGMTYTSIQSNSTNNAARKGNEFSNHVDGLPENSFFAVPEAPSAKPN